MARLEERLRIVISASLIGVTTSAIAAPQFPLPFSHRILAAHNAARAQAGVGPLAWDPALGRSAAAYARHMAFYNRFQHSDRRARRGVGENLWMGRRGSYMPEQMVGQWASERRWFAPGYFPNVGPRGWYAVSHYTQIIWPTTTRIGCAIASNTRFDYLVCHYSPAGNIDGRRVGFVER